MSQIYVPLSASSIPSNVPINFNVDLNEPFTPALPASAGTVNAVSNNLRIGGTNGIQTITNGNPGDLIIGFVEASGTTVGSATASLSLTIPINTVETYQIIVAGIADNNDGVGAYGSAVAKNIAGTASIIGNADLIINRDASLAGTNVVVSAAGNQFLVYVFGVVGRTIKWNIALPGIVSTT
jgi:hypothetical protein